MVAARFVAELDTGESHPVFYTDSNGMGLLKRVFDTTSNQNQSLYPAVAYSVLNDSATGFFVLNDRAQGAQSLANGQIDIALCVKTTLVFFENSSDVVVNTVCATTCPTMHPTQ
jgi:hypothetical protein